jgi:hypothetical protein
VLTKNNILVQASKILQTVSPIYWVKPTVSRRCVTYIFSEKRKWRNETYESVKWMKGEKPEDLETATDVVIKETSEGNWTADEYDKFCTQKKISMYFAQKMRF